MYPKDEKSLYLATLTCDRCWDSAAEATGTLLAVQAKRIVVLFVPWEVINCVEVAFGALCTVFCNSLPKLMETGCLSDRYIRLTRSKVFHPVNHCTYSGFSSRYPMRLLMLIIPLTNARNFGLNFVLCRNTKIYKNAKQLIDHIG